VQGNRTANLWSAQGSNNSREGGNERRKRVHGNIIEVVLEWLLELVKRSSILFSAIAS